MALPRSRFIRGFMTLDGETRLNKLFFGGVSLFF